VSEARDTKQHILSAALELFSVNGYSETSLREIAEKVGVSKPSLYHHFSSKDELLLELIRPISTAMEELLERAEAASPPPSAREFFKSFFDVVVEHREVSVWMSMDNTARAHPSLGEQGWQQQERLIRLLRGDDGSFERSVQVACALGAMQVGIMTFATFGRLDEARDRILESALIVLEGGPDRA
jgi:AcrR family transcriptional regulator